MNKPTQKKIDELKNQDVKKQLFQMLQMNDFEYNNTLFEIAMEFRERCEKGIPEFVEITKHSPLFWKWYQNHYLIIDRQFVYKVNEGQLFQLSRPELFSLYKDSHRSFNRFPHLAIYKEMKKEYASYIMINMRKEVDVDVNNK